MGGFIFLIQLFIIVVSIFSFIKMSKREKQNKRKNLEIFNKLKEDSLSETVSKDYLEKVNKLFSKKNIKGEKISLEGYFKVELITIQTKGGTNTTYEYFIDEMRVILPADIYLDMGIKYKVEGIFYKTNLYITKVNENNLLNIVDKLENLKAFREVNKEEKALDVNTRKILFGVILVLFTAIPFWKINILAYFFVYLLFILLYFFKIKKDKRILYKLNGVYSIDEFGNDTIDGMIVKTINLKPLTYDEGEEVEVIGYKNQNNFILTKYKGFNYIEEYKKTRKINAYTSFTFAIILFIISIFFINLSGVKKYFEYFKVKNKTEKYTNVDEFANDVILKQYVDLSSLYIFPYEFSGTSIRTMNYVLLEKDEYNLAIEKVRDKIIEFQDFEKQINNLLDNIDYALLYNKDEFMKGNIKYQNLKDLYFSSTTEKEVLVNAYWDFVNDTHLSLNNRIVEIQKEILENLDKKVIVENIYVSRSTGYYSVSNKIKGSNLSFSLIEFEIGKGIVKDIADIDNSKYIYIDTYSNYNDINQRKKLIYLLGLYWTFIFLLLLDGTSEIVRRVKIDKY